MAGRVDVEDFVLGVCGCGTQQGSAQGQQKMFVHGEVFSVEVWEV